MLQRKNKEMTVPVIQGGMGIGVSLGRLAGHVAKYGGMGVISTANAGFREEGFAENPALANRTGLAKEVKKAREIAGGSGLVAINAMAAVNDYREMVEAAVAAGVDAVISGAGLPMDLPAILENTGVLAAPVVSSGKAARTICKVWDKRYGVIPDFIVVEGSEAGGHLGFSKEELVNGTAQTLMEILRDVLKEIKPYEEKYGKDIPVFPAGGIFTGADMRRYTDAGATGVQMGTRFIATEECDASEAYKQMYLRAKKEDIQIVMSPVGMPGRALRTKLIERVEGEGRIPPKQCMDCLKPCDPGKCPYCITNALIEAHRGNEEEGLFFTGSNGYRLEKIVRVEELMEELMTDWSNG